MWLLMRNDKEILKTDGKWSYSLWSNSEDWLLFKTRDDAESHAEELGFAEFVSQVPLKSVFHEKHEHEAAMKIREESLLANCEYVSLSEPLTFSSTTDECDFPVFTTFSVTHYIVSSGVLCGVLGYGDGKYMPLQSIVGDEFDFAFCEVYELSKSVANTKNYVEAAQ